MRFTVTLLIWTLSLAVTSAFALPQGESEAAAPAGTADLRVYIHTGLPMLVQMERRTDATIRVCVPGQEEIVRKSRIRTEVDFIDEYGKYDDGVWEATRHFLRHHATVDGKVRDKELTGVVLECSCDGEQNFVKVGGGGKIAMKTLNESLRHCNSLGFWLPFPEAAAPGSKFAVDLTRAIPFLIDTDGTVNRADGEFTLTEIDAEKGIARLQGRVKIAETSEESGLSLLSEFDLAGQIEIDLDNEIISSLRLDGDASIESTQKLVKVEGKAKVALGFSTTIGEAVEKARRKKPRFRDALRTLEKNGVQLKLPSHWFIGDEEGQILFHSTLNGDAGVRYLEIKTFPSQGAPVGDVAKIVADDLKQTDPGLKMSTMRSGLGKGHSLRFSNEGLEFVLEIYALGSDQFVRIRLFGDKAGFKDGLKELKKARSSLKALGEQ